MKKLFVFALTILLMSSVAGFAQDMSKDKGTAPHAMSSSLLKNITGTVKADGDKLTFVSDKDKKSLEVINPQALKGYVGDRVEVSAHVYTDKGQIHVMSVKMLSHGSL